MVQANVVITEDGHFKQSYGIIIYVQLILIWLKAVKAGLSLGEDCIFLFYFPCFCVDEFRLWINPSANAV